MKLTYFFYSTLRGDKPSFKIMQLYIIDYSISRLFKSLKPNFRFIIFVLSLQLQQTVGPDISFDAVECPCINPIGNPISTVFTNKLTSCFAFCVVKKCYAFSFYPYEQECAVYAIGNIGYILQALQQMDCQGWPHAPVGRKWYLRTAGGAKSETITCDDYFTMYPHATDGPTDKLRQRGFKLSKDKNRHFCYREHGHQMRLDYLAFSNFITEINANSYHNMTAEGYMVRLEMDQCIIRMPSEINPFWDLPYFSPSIHGESGRRVAGGGACYQRFADYEGGGHYYYLNNTGMRISSEIDMECYGPTTSGGTVEQSMYHVKTFCKGQCSQPLMKHLPDYGNLWYHVPLFKEIF
ncbi:uncharacterized protein LOC142341440 [Convolutriloba macropyga]|uniref:uncharacterized protein LOC142341440 n=1 Tax=Convolutriloba macropyga TaxID=536237 RepID=UPI003F52717D